MTAPEQIVELTVPFHDCDPLFVVWHGRYFQYFERARCALLAELSLDIPDVRAMGYRMYVTDVRCRYMYPLAYGDRFAVRARVARSSPLIRITYQITNLTHGRKSARGYTDLATTDATGALISSTPSMILERLDG